MLLGKVCVPKKTPGAYMLKVAGADAVPMSTVSMTATLLKCPSEAFTSPTKVWAVTFRATTFSAEMFCALTAWMKTHAGQPPQPGLHCDEDI
jgi:hypothetical protein